MKKSEITPKMISDGIVELAAFAMKKEPNGDCTLCPLSEKPAFFDVELRVLHDNGEIDIIEEHENLTQRRAMKQIEKLEAEFLGLCGTWEFA